MCVLAFLVYLPVFQPSLGLASEHPSFELTSEELLSDDNLLIVDIVLGNYRLASDVFIYSSPEATVIPLQPLFDAVEFPIAVDPVALKAHGWFLRESNRFDLNVEQQQLVLGREVSPLSPSTMILSDDYDIYVDILALKKWFPFRVELQTSRLRLNIISDEPLPIEQQLEREKERKKSLLNTPGSQEPVVADNYRMLGVPVIDVNLGGTVRDAEQQPGEDGSSVETDASYSVQASADLLGLQGSLSVSRASTDGDTVERFTVYKRPDELDRNMPGELGYAAMGDIFSISNALVLNGGEGLGADFQFGGVRKASDFGKRVIEGEVTPGWEVELYRNGSLVDFQVASEDGRYRFEDVAVEYGENVFDIRLFGPQGQELSRRESIRVGEQALPRGEFYGRASHVNLDQRVFDSSSPDDSFVPGIGDEEQSYLLLQAGISDWLSSSVAYTRYRNGFGKQEDNEYTEIGFTGALPFAAVGLQHAEQKDAGHANLLSVQTRLGDTSISYLHKMYSDFESDRNPGARLSDDVELRLTGLLTPFDWNPLSYQLIAGLEENVNGSNNRSLETRVGFQFLNGRMTLDTNLNEGSFADRQVRGRARYLRVVGSKSSLRAALDYSIDPDTEITGASSSITWRPQQRLRTQFSLNGDFTGNGNNNLGLSLSYLFDEVTLSANTILQEGGGSSLLLNAEFSLGRENDRQWRINNQPQAAFGRLRGHVFLDHDQSGDFSVGDEPLPGVRFAGRREWEDNHTDENGVIFLRGLRTEFPSVVELDQGSLEDPYWRSSYIKKSFVSHAGGLHTLEIPIVVTAEIEGSLLIVKNGQVRPLAGIPVYLLDSEGQRAANAITEFDGFFVLENIIPAGYHLDIDSEALAKFGISQFSPVPVAVSAEQGVVYLDSIILDPLASDQQPAKLSIETGLQEQLEKKIQRLVKEQPQPATTATPEGKVGKPQQYSRSSGEGGSQRVFRIQVAAYRGELPERYAQIGDLQSLPGKNGLTRYVTRTYNSYVKAAYRQRELLDAGFEGAFIFVGKPAASSGTVDRPVKPVPANHVHEDKTEKAPQPEKMPQPEHEPVPIADTGSMSPRPETVKAIIENEAPTLQLGEEQGQQSVKAHTGELSSAKNSIAKKGIEKHRAAAGDGVPAMRALLLLALLMALIAVLVMSYRYLAPGGNKRRSAEDN